MAESGPGITGATGGLLRLRAEDADDLAIISACLQDALVPVRDLAYDAEARSFILVANRFRWEASAPKPPDASGFERILCGVVFDEVDGVAYRGFHRNKEDRILSLLTIQSVAGQSFDGAIHLEFATGATIRLSVAALNCRAHDFGEPWPTVWQPGHELDSELEDPK
jgi:hypothetical protein